MATASKKYNAGADSAKNNEKEKSEQDDEIDSSGGRNKAMKKEEALVKKMYGLRSVAVGSLTQKLVRKNDVYASEIKLEYDLGNLEEVSLQYQGIYEDRIIFPSTCVIFVPL